MFRISRSEPWTSKTGDSRFMVGYSFYAMGYTRYEIYDGVRVQINHGMLHIFFACWSKYFCIEWRKRK